MTKEKKKMGRPRIGKELRVVFCASVDESTDKFIETYANKQKPPVPPGQALDRIITTFSKN